MRNSHKASAFFEQKELAFTGRYGIITTNLGRFFAGFEKPRPSLPLYMAKAFSEVICGLARRKYITNY